MKAIPLTKGFIALVDDEDYERLSQYKWRVGIYKRTVYAVRSENAKANRIYMHRDIMQPPAGLEVDHKNHCGIDNRKSNLRVCTRRVNMQNKRRFSKPATQPLVTPRSPNASRYKGVSWHERSKKWLAQITVDHTVIYLGVFTDEHAAHLAYVRAVERLQPKDRVDQSATCPINILTAD